MATYSSEARMNQGSAKGHFYCAACIDPEGGIAEKLRYNWFKKTRIDKMLDSNPNKSRSKGECK
jgi:hypothetical protein